MNKVYNIVALVLLNCTKRFYWYVQKKRRKELCSIQIISVMSVSYTVSSIIK